MAMYQETDKAPYAPAVLEANTESLKRQVGGPGGAGAQGQQVSCLQGRYLLRIGSNKCAA
jgi:hypothetical protein